MRQRARLSLGNGGSTLAGLLVACFVGALGGALLTGAGAPASELVVAAWELFWRTPPGWLLERLGRLLSPIALDLGVPGWPRWDVGHNMVLGAALPGIVYLLHRLRRSRWRAAVLRSNLGVLGEVALGGRRAADIDSPQQLAARVLADRGVAADPAAGGPRARRSDPSFAEAEAAASALLDQLARKPESA